MKTDYQNLNLFEGLAVFLAAVGVGLVSTMMFMSMPSEQQISFKQAVAFLDIHEQAQAEMKTLALSFGLYENFLDEFYIASTEILAVPESQLQETIRLIGHVRQGTEKILALHPKPGGQVLGVSIEKCSDPPKPAYSPPRLDLELVKNNLNNLIP